MHHGHKVRIWAMIETPTAIFNVRQIASAATDAETRLTGFVLGTNDLAKETRAKILPGRAPMLPWLSTCLLAAREYGIDILDGVFNDIANTQGFAEECAQARDMGFDGKTLIHPNQIEPCNAAFSPTADEVAAGAQDDRGVRSAGEQGQGRGADRRPHGRAHACRDGAPHVAIADAIAASAKAGTQSLAPGFPLARELRRPVVVSDAQPESPPLRRGVIRATGHSRGLPAAEQALVLVVTILASTISYIDESVVNVALRPSRRS
jgi:citrate lyase beta subunit